MISKIKLKFFSNKFDVEIVYMFNVGIIKITFRLLLIKNNLCFF